LNYEQAKATLASAIIDNVVEFIEAHKLTDWCHELPNGNEEIIESYLIPKNEVEDLRTAVKLFLEKAKYLEQSKE